ncbi:MAG: chlorite dismutase family protein [Polyangiaceae bacterium]|nr:chlorite dismutase family protein [Polyangiaceae bacterium]
MPEPLPSPDINEYGAEREGLRQRLDRRLFLQLLVVEAVGNRAARDLRQSLAAGLEQRGATAVIYEDLNHPAGLGLLALGEDPGKLADLTRPLFAQHAGALRLRPEFTMLGRTYATGFETDLEHWLLHRPRETVFDERWPWAIWYPLRRSGTFERLSAPERGEVLREHGRIGRAYGDADLAHDIRLACHGLDANDNEFIIGLVGRELHALSRIVEVMRHTRQTAEFVAHMGPFFVGRVVWRSPGR